MKEVLEFLKKCRVFYVATVEGDQPRVRPFGIVEEFEGKLYIQTGKIKNVFKQLEINPKAEICGFDNEGNWIRVETQLYDDDRLEAKEYVLNLNPSLKGMYAADDGNTSVLYLKNSKATFYSFTQAPRVVEF